MIAPDVSFPLAIMAVLAGLGIGGVVYVLVEWIEEEIRRIGE